MMLSSLYSVPSAHAQIVTNTYPQIFVSSMPINISTTFSTPPSFTTSDDALTNCDALEDPNGPIKAIAWSKCAGANLGSGYPLSNICQFYVEDYAGNSVIIDLADAITGFPGAMQPDIVLANSPGPNGMAGYQVLVVYFVAKPAPATVGDAYLDVYDLVDVGLPSFHVAQRGASIKFSTTCNGYPHIDMWSDATSLTSGLPTMREFATVWAENSTGDLTAMFGTVNSPSNPPTPIGTVSNAWQPDVACLTETDRRTGVIAQKIELTYATGVVDPLTRGPSPSGGNLFQLEYNYTTLTAGTPLVLNGLRCFAPRIEAMSGGGTGVKWQIAVSTGSTSGPAVVGYNNLTSQNLSNVTLLQAGPPMGAAVAGGVGPATGSTSNIGNRQYTAGFYPWGTHWAYARDISATTGSTITANAYVINDTSTYIDYPWDVNQNLSLSNCSNSGLDLFAAWADSLGINYKYSSSNGITTFRRANTFLVGSDAALYPNPAASTVHFAKWNVGDHYVVTDNLGRAVRNGMVSAGGNGDVTGLAAGNYFLQLRRADGTSDTYKFTKE